MNTKGFSLIEIIVVGGIIAILGVGLSSLLATSFKGQKSIEQRAEARSQFEDLRAIIGDPAVCLSNFQNLDPNNGPVAQIVNAAGEKQLVLEQKVNGLNVESIGLSNFVADTANPREGVANFVISFKKTINSPGTDTMNRSFPIRVRLNAANRIDRCVALFGKHDQNFQYNVDGTIFYGGGNVGIGTNTPRTKIDVDGSIKIGNDPQACTPAIAGAIRFLPGPREFEACDGDNWLKVITEEPFHWVNKTTTHAATCASVGSTVAADQGYGICASGERRPTAGGDAAKINFIHGTWGGTGQAGSQITGNFCYSPGQKRDNDGTDLTVAYLCER